MTACIKLLNKGIYVPELEFTTEYIITFSEQMQTKNLWLVDGMHPSRNQHEYIPILLMILAMQSHSDSFSYPNLSTERPLSLPPHVYLLSTNFAIGINSCVVFTLSY